MRGEVNLARLLKWKYSPSLLLSGANTLCSVAFQFGTLSKLGIGVRSDLYYASILIPTVLFGLVFGAVSSILVPMFVEAKAARTGDDTTLLWNCLFLTTAGGLSIIVVFYFPVVTAFPWLFHKLSWVDPRQVGGVLLTFSLYQILYLALLTKSCFLFSRGRPLTAQLGTFAGWFVSLFFLFRVHQIQNLEQIPLCLVAGNAAALVYPNWGRGSFDYTKGLLRSQTASLVSRNMPLIVGGSASSRLEPLFDGVLASFCREGSLTIYFFFGRIMLYMATIVSSGYVQPAQKMLAEVAGEGRWEVLRSRTRALAVRATLISVGLMTGAVLFLAFLYSWGFAAAKPYFKYFAEDWAVFFLMWGYLVGMVLGIVYSSSLFALRKERLFLFATLLVLPAGVLFKFVGAYTYNLGGLALGTSLYWLLNAATLVFVFSRYVGAIEIATVPLGAGQTSTVKIRTVSASEEGY